MAAQRDLKVGIALGSGGARGWCHIGVLRELAEMDIKADVIAGASMGALVGAVHAGGALDELEDWALKLTARSFFGLLDVRLTSGGLFEGEEIRNVIGGFDMPERIGSARRSGPNGRKAQRGSCGTGASGCPRPCDRSWAGMNPQTRHPITWTCCRPRSRS